MWGQSHDGLPVVADEEESGDNREADQDRLKNGDSQNTVDKRHSRSSTAHPNDKKDGLRAWLMCFLCATVTFNIYGFYSCYGFFLIEFLREFKESEAITAWVGSLATTMHFACYLLGSLLQYHLNVQTICIAGAVLMLIGLSVTSLVHTLELMFLTYGIIYGLGTGLSTSLFIACVPDFFERKRALAVAVIMCGSSFGKIVYPLFIAFLLHRFSWRDVFRIVLYMPVCVFICSFTFKKRNLSNRSVSQKQEYLSFLQDKRFVWWCLGAASAFSTFWVTYQFMVPFCKDLGYSTDKGSLLMTYLGAASMIGQLLMGYLGDVVKSIRKVNILICLTLLGAVVNFQVAFATCYWSLVLFACTHGFILGSLLNVVVVGTMDFVPGGNFRSAWGVFAFVMAALQMAGPPTAGLLYDTYHNYKPVYLMCAALFVLSDFILIPLSWVSRAGTSRRALLESEELSLNEEYELVTSL